jgi:hypothetical protein
MIITVTGKFWWGWAGWRRAVDGHRSGMDTGRVREAAGLLGVKGDSGYASCVPWLGCRSL